VEAWHAQRCAFVIRVTSAEFPNFVAVQRHSTTGLPTFRVRKRGGARRSTPATDRALEAIMKEALQPTLILVLWIVLWLAGTLGGAVLQAWLIDVGVLSEIDPPWIITIGSSFVGFFAGAYAAVKLGDLRVRQK
jgi:hypothetical protein